MLLAVSKTLYNNQQQYRIYIARLPVALHLKAKFF
jgi:hypothetical protein